MKADSGSGHGGDKGALVPEGVALTSMLHPHCHLHLPRVMITDSFTALSGRRNEPGPPDAADMPATDHCMSEWSLLRHWGTLGTTWHELTLKYMQNVLDCFVWLLQDSNRF